MGKIFYVSNFIGKEAFARLFAFGNNTPGQQVQKYNGLLAKGLTKAGKASDNSVLCISVPPCMRENNKSLFVDLGKSSEDGIDFSYIKLINFPILKNISVYFGAKKELSKAFKKGGCDFIVVDLLSIFASFGTVNFARKHKIPVIGIVTDFPEYLPGGCSSIFEKLFFRNAGKCDGFVLMTEQMRDFEKIKAFGKKSIIIEGIADSDKLLAERENLPDKNFADKDGKKIVFYAGRLEKEFGINELCEGFLSPEISDDFALWICGNGSEAENIKALSEKHPGKIKYLGVISNSEAVEIQKKAYLLVNPRRATEEFTKYSFPSKNLEYMASGTPYLGYMLPGMPKAYENYFITCDDIKEGLEKALSMDENELKNLGKAAQKFVFENKSEEIQGRRLIEFVKNEI